MIHLEAIFVAILVFTCFVHGNVFYVSVSNGVDSGTCGNQTTPCISISSALIAAKNDFLQTGNHSTIFVESGIYQEPQLLVESPVFLISRNGSVNTIVSLNNQSISITSGFTSNYPILIQGFTFLSTVDVIESFILFDNLGSFVFEDILIQSVIARLAMIRIVEGAGNCTGNNFMITNSSAHNLFLMHCISLDLNNVTIEDSVFTETSELVADEIILNDWNVERVFNVYSIVDCYGNSTTINNFNFSNFNGTGNLCAICISTGIGIISDINFSNLNGFPSLISLKDDGIINNINSRNITGSTILNLQQGQTSLNNISLESSVLEIAGISIESSSINGTNILANELTSVNVILIAGDSNVLLSNLNVTESTISNAILMNTNSGNLNIENSWFEKNHLFEFQTLLIPALVFANFESTSKVGSVSISETSFIFNTVPTIRVENGFVKLIDTIFTSNDLRENIIQITKSNSIIIENLIFDDNTANTLIDIQDSMATFTNSSLSQNHVIQSVLSFENTIVTMEDITIRKTSYVGQIPYTTVEFTKTNATILNYESSNNEVQVGGAILAVENSNIIIDNANIFNNVATLGGGIYCSDSDISVHLSSISKCTAIDGGGITISGSTGEIISTTITDCAASSIGGGFYSNQGSILNVNNVTLQYCKANNGAGGYVTDSSGIISNTNYIDNISNNTGGGMCIQGSSTISLDTIVFTNNTGLNGGCLTSADYSTPTISNSEFNLCTALISGGAFRSADYSKPIFNNCTFRQSSASSIGCAIKQIDFSNATYTNTLFTNNSSPNEGGGLYLADSTYGYLENVTFSYNYAGSSAGALVLASDSSADVYSCLFDSNSCGTNGGAMAIFNQGQYLMKDTTFRNNTGKSGGAMYSSDSTFQTIINSTFSQNIASTRGGAIYSTSSAILNIINCMFDKNIAESAPGGGIVVQDSAFIDITDSTLTNNYATEGAAIFVSSDKGIISTKSMVNDNHATTSGGAIALRGSSESLWIDLTCTGNSAIIGFGGCISIQAEANSTFINATITNNQAADGGGIGNIGNSFLVLLDSKIENNQATDGGGLFIYHTSTITVNNTIIRNNIAIGNGGGLSIAGDQSKFYDVLFEGNTALKGGGIIMPYSSSKTTKFTHCQLSKNIASGEGGGLYLYASDTTTSLNSTLEYDFYNITIDNNHAFAGGGIYFDSSSNSTPTFGPTCLIMNNTADTYGGGVLFERYFEPSVNIYNGIFENNIGIFGGSSVGFLSIKDTSDASLFCSNCSFSSEYNSGYQNDKGFATIPSKLIISNETDTCPATIQLNDAPFSVEVYLVDEFYTIVKGELLIDHPVNVSYSCSPVNEFACSSKNQSLQLSDISGSAIFGGVSVCGQGNTNFELEFIGYYVNAEDYTISNAVCTIYLGSCPSGYVIVPNDITGCDVCQYQSSDDHITPFSMVLLILLVILCCVICVITGVLGAWKIRQLRKAYLLRQLVIPDFKKQGNLTIQMIIDDPAINIIHIDDIEIGDVIGKGASGLVTSGYLNCDTGERKPIAIKELILGQDDMTNEVLEEFLVEIKYMSVLQHEYIVAFLGVAVVNECKIYLITELMQKGSIRAILDKKSVNLSDDLRLKFAKDAAKGMAFLHSKRLIHRDLKPANLLVDDTWTCKIADFGIATVKPTITREMTCVGTPVYMAPEVLKRSRYSEKADIYSFAIVLWELFTGKRPYTEGKFANMNHATLMYQISESGERPSLAGLNPAVQLLISDCWNSDIKLRPSFNEIIVRLRRLQGMKLYIPHENEDDEENSIVDNQFLQTYEFSYYSESPEEHYIFNTNDSINS